MSRTIKVRIAVAVDAEGVWAACGFLDSALGVPSNGEAMDVAVDGVGEGEARYWVEVELPVPDRTPVTHTGTVTRADS